MNYHVYAIKSKSSDRIYVGMSKNVERRIEEYNSKQVKSTKAYTPWFLIYKENCGNNRKRARKREEYFKSGCGREFLKNIIT